MTYGKHTAIHLFRPTISLILWHFQYFLWFVRVCQWLVRLDQLFDLNQCLLSYLCCIDGEVIRQQNQWVRVFPFLPVTGTPPPFRLHFIYWLSFECQVLFSRENKKNILTLKYHSLGSFSRWQICNILPRKQALTSNTNCLQRNLHEMSKPFSGISKKNISKCGLLKFLPRLLSIKCHLAILKFCRVMIKSIDFSH